MLKRTIPQYIVNVVKRDETRGAMFISSSYVTAGISKITQKH